jgi:hypothetical protein
MIYQMGVNSQNSNLKSYAAALWQRWASRGILTWATTLTPQASSTDSWATVGNQTVMDTTKESFRTAYNDWLRSGAPLDAVTKAPVAIGTSGALLAGTNGHPLKGYFEVADLAEMRETQASGRPATPATEPTRTPPAPPPWPPRSTPAFSSPAASRDCPCCRTSDQLFPRSGLPGAARSLRESNDEAD